METKVLVSNIQRFCLHDGPGIRTNVFFKGCNLHCPWCTNPENINFQQEKYFVSRVDDESKGIYGNWMSLQNIYDEVVKDRLFYKDGGVTFSGGEPLLFMSKIQPLLKVLQCEGINICVETALFVPEKELHLALKYVDTLIIDIKILDKEQCKIVHGGSLKDYLHNIQIVNDADVDVIYRIPLIKPYTTHNDNINRIICFLQNKKYSQIELIKGHNLAERKYQSLKREGYIVPDISEEELDAIQSKFKKKGIQAEICRI